MKTVGVLLPLPLEEIYSYRVPEEMAPTLTRGDFVHVPWGKGATWGVVWTENPPIPPGKTLKSLESVSAINRLPPASQAFLTWVAQYYLGTKGAVLKMVFPVPKALSPLKNEVFFENPSLTASPVVLSPSQAEAAEALKAQIQQDIFSVTLLEGVTGSGKTEVYFEALRVSLQQNKQVLVLLPEISLTTQWLHRFEKNFGVTPAIWHGDLSPTQRAKTLRAIAQGRAPVTVGARSALFLPYPQLGLIIVDEEHDPSYKQEEGFIYHARDMAVVRAQVGKCPLILASATPSLETLWNVEKRRYHHVLLEDRYQAQLPQLHLIDLRTTRPKDKEKTWISPLLRQHLHEGLARGEQSLLYLNRRGYAPLLLCRLCGERLSCKNCHAWLVVHQHRHQLQCHHCGHRRPLPQDCLACGAAESLVPCGPGVERIAQEVKTLFPQARTAVMSRDTLSTPQKLTDLMTQIESRAVDILIGTQLVVKGHHFPYLTCVGVIDGDLSLHGGDPRACEKTYQLLHQVAGRAGRATHPGQVFLQTYAPDHPVLQALLSGDRHLFLEQELQDRAAHRLPPFGRLAALILSGSRADHVQSYAAHLAKCIPRHEGVDVLGPAPAPLTVLRGKSRWRFLVKAPRAFPLQNFLKTWLQQKRPPASVQLHIDIDPYTFL